MSDVITITDRHTVSGQEDQSQELRPVPTQTTASSGELSLSPFEATQQHRLLLQKSKSCGILQTDPM